MKLKLAGLAAIVIAGVAVYQVAPQASAGAAGPGPVPIHIRAGDDAGLTNNGVTWVGAGGYFADGDTIARPEEPISNTDNPDLYRSERYSMTKFTYPVANGKYTVKLHFSETYEGISGPGQRVFSFNVCGQKTYTNFDVCAMVGHSRADIETIPVTITNEKIEINFFPQTENPQINGVEILPGF